MVRVRFGNLNAVSIRGFTPKLETANQKVAAMVLGKGAVQFSAWRVGLRIQRIGAVVNAFCDNNNAGVQIIYSNSYANRAPKAICPDKKKVRLRSEGER